VHSPLNDAVVSPPCSCSARSFRALQLTTGQATTTQPTTDGTVEASVRDVFPYLWHVAAYLWHVAPYLWHVAPYLWHVAPYLWHIVSLARCAVPLPSLILRRDPPFPCSPLASRTGYDLEESDIPIASAIPGVCDKASLPSVNQRIIVSYRRYIRHKHAV